VSDLPSGVQPLEAGAYVDISKGAELVGGLAGEWGDWLKGRLPAGSRMTWAPF